MTNVRSILRSFVMLIGFCSLADGEAVAVEFVGKVIDSSSGKALAARVYVKEATKNEWLFVRSTMTEGSALPYSEEWVPQPNSTELHTTISPHPFRVELNPGIYQIRVERGKEYLPAMHQAIVNDSSDTLEHTFALRRWVNMADRGWYSGETHVHRRVRELKNVMLAEDLNVAFPVTFWTTDADQAPNLKPSRLRGQGPSPFGPRIDYGRDPISIDPTHVIYPRNTEYEVFHVNGKPHVMGAIFILNHATRFEDSVPPIGEVARKAHSQGALLDLDKHNWPWSMMLVPVAKVDLYELANNSLWKTEFGFRHSAIKPAPYMNVAMDGTGMTERGWIDFGLQNYYALLNCGFRLQPTAGTASGVHPVPLGFGRVYVHLQDAFDGAGWLAGLKQGQSFVTTGPMIDIQINQRPPGQVFHFDAGDEAPIRVHGEMIYSKPLDTIELVVNGRVAASLRPDNSATPAGAFRSRIDQELMIRESSWVILRCFHESRDRVRFAHTAPWHFDFGGRPVQPRSDEVQYLIDRVTHEIDRNRAVLSPAALSEFESALTIYQQILARARP